MTHTEPARSPGAKLIAVGALGLLLGVPLGLVGLLKWERMERARGVMYEVAQRAGEPQVLSGPQLAVPYTYPERVVHQTTEGQHVENIERQGTLYVSPATLDIDVQQTTERLHRAIYEVPVQTSQLTFVARFDGFRLPSLPKGAVIDWSAARWLMGVSDPRGLGRFEVHRADARALAFEPAKERILPYSTLSAPAKVEGASHAIELRGRVQASGVESMMFSAAGVRTSVKMTSDWPHPSFDGSFAPAARDISDAGFTARWSISGLARGAPEVAVDRPIDQTATFGVRLLNPSDGYAKVGRSLKYGLLFVVLALGAFLVLELSSQVPVHPMQYAMIGLVQVSFYLLLLALSEHTSVGAAYALAGAATTVLTGLYALWTFGSVRFAAAILFSIGLSYAFQYTLVQLEDHALLVGSMIVFGGLATLMYATRKVQWYRSPPLEPAAQAELDRLEREGGVLPRDVR